MPSALRLVKVTDLSDRLKGNLGGIYDNDSPSPEEMEEMEYAALFGLHTQEVLQMLSRLQAPVVFYAGSEKLNPVPLLAIGMLKEGLAGGFMSAVIHT